MKSLRMGSEWENGQRQPQKDAFHLDTTLRFEAGDVDAGDPATNWSMV